jgi:FAD binding domain
MDQKRLPAGQGLPRRVLTWRAVARTSMASASTAGSLAGLATLIGVNAEGLTATVARWNEACVNGTDQDFGRGGPPMTATAATRARLGPLTLAR